MDEDNNLTNSNHVNSANPGDDLNMYRRNDKRAERIVARIGALARTLNGGFVKVLLVTLKQCSHCSGIYISK